MTIILLKLREVHRIGSRLENYFLTAYYDEDICNNIYILNLFDFILVFTGSYHIAK